MFAVIILTLLHSSHKLTTNKNYRNRNKWIITYSIDLHRSIKFWDSVNIRFLESRISDLNEFGFFSQLLQITSSSVAHAASNSACVTLKNELQWPSEWNVPLDSFSAEGLWIDFTTGFFHFGNVGSNWNKIKNYVQPFLDTSWRIFRPC